MKKHIVIYLLLAVFSFTLIYCSHSKKETVTTPLYKNWNDTVDYVGMNTCKTCHQNIYETFIQTGMGQSWDHATQKKSSAKFNQHAVLYDKYKDFYYKPFWKDSSLYIMEYRLSGKDTIFKRIERISYIVGSGQHTNSHIWEENGYLYQAPMTYYTQHGLWDLPPGFEEGSNTRWNRIISVECMNCHNMYPEREDENDAANKFISVKTGIECERCHGPGEAHVNEKLKGILVDTSVNIDYSIVNPANLSRDLQVELCQRCHLQGISVLNEGKTFFDFKPGQPLNSVMNVFMPRYEGGEGKFIMASHADRMKQSKCYISSDMSCLTCHNPHVSVKFTPAAHFNDACKSCHNTQEKNCKLSIDQRLKENNNNCYKCHMPVSETMDIPHVTVHDHRIHVPVSEEQKKQIQKFVGLECMTTKNPSPLLVAEGYLQTYEAFSQQPYLLDSAAYYLNKVTDKATSHLNETEIRYHYLKNNFDGVVSASVKLVPEKINNAWTAYRIGEGNYQKGNFQRALSFYSRACELKPADPEFRNKYGSTLVALKRMDEAQEVFQKIVGDNSKFAPALSNLGYVYFLKGDLKYAESLYNKALALDPDYEQALMNKIALFMVQRKNREAEEVATQLLKINPENEKVKTILKQMHI
ncbi:MAG: tetratricopeptide repeat protein [Chitinophagales bacterium]|nr:tetratricopeptide repeat protein [Chitinophagales bacterium]